MKPLFTFFVLFIIVIPLLHAQDTMNVRAGWNIVGARSTRTISEFISEPPGIIISNYFGYSSGYTEEVTLIGGKGYWVKASADGIIIGGATSDFVCGTSSVEYGGINYNTAQIGTQCWFKENLNVGTMIYGIINQTNNSIIEKYCYNDSMENCNTYGGLYQWNEAMQYSTSAGVQGICPTGWHIPTDAELQTLNATVNNNGNALKAIGQGTGGGAGTNASGFSALLSGSRTSDDIFYNIGYFTFFRSSTEYDATGANILYLYYYDSNITFDTSGKESGFSVRCIQD
ncbi:MAG: hypothetical protein HYZ34_09740 [Ignavibacteriae bacterium]|nr:hypothetical protein [Ignavibacteriota bacterium]